MPILRIVLEVAVLHQLVVLQYRHPVTVILQLVAAATAARGRNELLNGYGVGVEVLEGHVRKEGYLVVFVETHFDVGGAGLLGLCALFVGYSYVSGLDLEFGLRCATEPIQVISVIAIHSC